MPSVSLPAEPGSCGVPSPGCPCFPTDRREAGSSLYVYTNYGPPGRGRHGAGMRINRCIGDACVGVSLCCIHKPWRASSPSASRATLTGASSSPGVLTVGLAPSRSSISARRTISWLACAVATRCKFALLLMVTSRRSSPSPRSSTSLEPSIALWPRVVGARLRRRRRRARRFRPTGATGMTNGQGGENPNRGALTQGTQHRRAKGFALGHQCLRVRGESPRGPRGEVWWKAVGVRPSKRERSAVRHLHRASRPAAAEDPICVGGADVLATRWS